MLLLGVGGQKSRIWVKTTNKSQIFWVCKKKMMEGMQMTEGIETV